MSLSGLCWSIIYFCRVLTSRDSNSSSTRPDAARSRTKLLFLTLKIGAGGLQVVNRALSSGGGVTEPDGPRFEMTQDDKLFTQHIVRRVGEKGKETMTNPLAGTFFI